MSLFVLTYYNRNDEIARANSQKSIKKFQKDYKFNILYGQFPSAQYFVSGALTFQLQLEYTGFNNVNVKKI